jgi:hypothetical protein
MSQKEILPHKELVSKLKKVGSSSSDILKELEKKGCHTSLRSLERFFKNNNLSNIAIKKTTNDSLREEVADEFNLPDDINAKVVWLKSKRMSAMIKVGENIVSFEDMKKEFRDFALNYSPSFKKIKRKAIKDPHCLVLDPADIHIGKYSSIEETGEAYNQEIAVNRVIEGTKGVLSKCAGFNIDKIVLVVGNDVLHTDNSKRTTTSGTPQDTDKNWYDNYIAARDLYINIISILKKIADVTIIHCPSNHDYITGWMLADSLSCYYNKDRNVDFDVSMAHRKYFRYGRSLIGLSHGDGAKMDLLPLLMAEESKNDWADSKYRYWYLHHIHHFKKFKYQTGTDTPGCTVEFLRSPSGTDSWHHRNGYEHAPKAIEAFIHSKEFGQVAKVTHLF